MKSFADAELGYEAFARLTEVDAALVDSEPTEINLREYLECRLDGPAGFAP